MIRACVLACLVVFSWPVARADEPDRESRARAHYEVGLGMYHLGNYRDAVREFTAGYELSPRPEFLINLGQAYRKLHDLDRAREMFQRYLAQSAGDVAQRKQVEDLLAEVDHAAAAAPPPMGSAAPSATSQPSASVDAVRAAPARPSALRRFWWTIPVAAVLVGTAVGLGVYFGTPPAQVACSSASIGCVDLRH